MSWKLGKDKRQAQRFKVRWAGTLTCLFPDHEQDVEAGVTEVSAGGARLELKSLEVGPYHIVIGSESSRFTLKVSLPEAAISVPVRVVWYSTDQERDLFNLGVMFLQSEERIVEIEKLAANFALGASSL